MIPAEWSVLSSSSCDTPSRFVSRQSLRSAKPPAAARVVDAQCCTPPYEVPPQSMNYRFEADDPLTPLSGIQAATEYAKNLWVGEFTSRGENISMQQGAGGLRIVVTTSSNVPPGDGLADRSTKTIWLASDLVGPTYSVDYLRAVLLHEIGHIQGWGQATCSGSVMSNTNPDSYRTTFSDCDKAEFRVRYGDRVDDPCAEGCAPGYSTTCLGDQQPDACGCCINYSPIMIAVDDPQIWLSDAHAELFGNTTRLRSGALARRECRNKGQGQAGTHYRPPFCSLISCRNCAGESFPRLSESGLRPYGMTRSPWSSNALPPSLVTAQYGVSADPARRKST